MSQQGVKKLVGRLISDDSFRKAFHDNPSKATAESGYHLDERELAALAKLKPTDLQVNVKHGHGTAASYELDVRSAKL